MPQFDDGKDNIVLCPARNTIGQGRSIGVCSTTRDMSWHLRGNLKAQAITFGNQNKQSKGLSLLGDLRHHFPYDFVGLIPVHQTLARLSRT